MLIKLQLYNNAFEHGLYNELESSKTGKAKAFEYKMCL